MASRNTPTKPKHTINTRIDLDTFLALKDYAVAKNVSVTWVINATLGQAAKKMTVHINQTA
jgi:hypothetical protein